MILADTNIFSAVAEAQRDFALDFDDAYQVAVAQTYHLNIATMDRDYRRVTGLEILFLSPS